VEFLHTVVRQTYGVLILDRVTRIIDAGANCGDSTCWFLSRYPQSQVIALEPDSSNFEILQRNTFLYGTRADCRQAALWATPSKLACVGVASTDVRMVVDESGPIHGLTPEELVNDGVDIFKIDIEGAEVDLFSRPCDWLRRCRLVFVDVHSQQADDLIRAAAMRYGMVCQPYRELLVLHPA
jgi:FkbM family methyltransferase